MTVLRLLPLWLLITRTGPVKIESLATRILPILAAVVSTYAGLLLMRDALPDTALVRLIAGTLLSYMLFASVFSLSGYGRPLLREVVDLSANALSKLRLQATRRIARSATGLGPP